MSSLSCSTLSADPAETIVPAAEDASLTASSSAPDEQAASDQPGNLEGVWCHKTATVEEPASIGPGTHIGPWSHIMTGATVGSACRIGRNVVVAPTAVIGDGVVIGDNVVVEDGVTLESGVYCGSGVAFATIPRPRAAFLTGIPNALSLQSGSGVNPVKFDPESVEPKPILVREGASLGAGSTILGGVTVRAYAVIEPGAAVAADVRSYARMSGAPAQQTGWICLCGAPLRNGEDWTIGGCPQCKQLYWAGGPGLEPTNDERERRERDARNWGFLRRVERITGAAAAK
jgi:UDP-2-acetamido-3-amino-2,3-dideoxy-glucuronate N-acetyltransferase